MSLNKPTEEKVDEVFVFACAGNRSSPASSEEGGRNERMHLSHT